MASPSCPTCRSEFVRRASRQGLLERLLSVGYLYPFRCQICRHRFRTLRWGERYVRVELDRRDFERLATDIRTAVTWRERHGQGKVLDLSVAGCTLETDSPVPVGELLHLELAPEGEAPVVVDVAECRSVRASRLGLKFVKIQNIHEERLRQLVLGLLLAAKPR